MTIFHFYRLH